MENSTTMNRSLLLANSRRKMVPRVRKNADEAKSKLSSSSILEQVLRLFQHPGGAGEAQRNAEVEILKYAESFLNDNDCVNTNVTLDELKDRFSESELPIVPKQVDDYMRNFNETVVRDAIHTSAPQMIGHMTSALPFFHRALSVLVTAMNQNTVKIETGKTVTFLERQVIAMIHRIIYHQENAFYDSNCQDNEKILGFITSGGTLANVAALWAARNSRLGPDGDFAGIEKKGLLSALRHYGYDDCVIVGSQLLHYSLNKAADMLGMGTDQIRKIPVDRNFQMRLDVLEETLEECKRNRILVISVVGLAGATETGSIDNLTAVGEMAHRFGAHYHVDAAWGGPCLFSREHSQKMAGVEIADSVTLDGHKQLYVPMGCGLVFFRDPVLGHAISKTANYIIRKGTYDLGRYTIEGSRPAACVYLHATLNILGVRGMEALVDRSCNMTKLMAEEVKCSSDFELIVEPHCNILLYRWIPASLREAVAEGTLTPEQNEYINEMNRELQALQSARGKTFVSRTTVFSAKYDMHVVGLRVVIANPLTTGQDVLFNMNDQRELVLEFCEDVDNSMSTSSSGELSDSASESCATEQNEDESMSGRVALSSSPSVGCTSCSDGD